MRVNDDFHSRAIEVAAEQGLGTLAAVCDAGQARRAEQGTHETCALCVKSQPHAPAHPADEATVVPQGSFADESGDCCRGWYLRHPGRLVVTHGSLCDERPFPRELVNCLPRQVVAGFCPTRAPVTGVGAPVIAAAGLLSSKRS